MLETTKQELLAVIDKNLSAEAGGIIKDRLLYLEKLEIENKNLKENLRKESGDRVTLESMLSSYKKLDEYKIELDKRELEISVRERNQKVWEAEHKVVEAEKRCNEMAGFVGLVFKSPVFRTTVFENGTIPSGQYGTVNASKNKTIEKTEG